MLRKSKKSKSPDRKSFRKRSSAVANEGSGPGKPTKRARASISGTMRRYQVTRFDQCFESQLERIHNLALRAAVREYVLKIVRSYIYVPSIMNTCSLINKARKELSPQFPDPVKETIGPRLVRRINA